MATVRRLGPEDLETLATLCREDPDFDVEGRSEPLPPLAPEAARALLADPNVLFWVAETPGQLAGFLLCHLLRKRGGVEVLLYEIGVRSNRRRQGVGRALLATLEAWMGERGIEEAWVLADNPGAEAFYADCGYTLGEGQATYMVREVSSRR